MLTDAPGFGTGVAYSHRAGVCSTLLFSSFSRRHVWHYPTPTRLALDRINEIRLIRGTRTRQREQRILRSYRI